MKRSRLAKHAQRFHSHAPGFIEKSFIIYNLLRAAAARRLHRCVGGRCCMTLKVCVCCWRWHSVWQNGRWGSNEHLIPGYSPLLSHILRSWLSFQDNEASVTPSERMPACQPVGKNVFTVRVEIFIFLVSKGPRYNQACCRSLCVNMHRSLFIILYWKHIKIVVWLTCSHTHGMGTHFPSGDARPALTLEPLFEGYGLFISGWDQTELQGWKSWAQVKWYKTEKNHELKIKKLPVRPLGSKTIILLYIYTFFGAVSPPVLFVLIVSSW